MELRNRNSSTAFCSHSFTCFTCFYIFSHFFTWSKRMFSHFFQSHFQKAFFLHCFTFFHKNVKRCEKKTFENPVGKVELCFFSSVWFFGAQFCCNYFAAGPTSAGWKSERSSSNRSEVDCADRRSVFYIYSKAMTTRSKNRKSNAEGKENIASNLLLKIHFFTLFLHV